MKCKKCNSKMDLMESDNILGYWSYVCSDEKCDCIATIDDRNDYIEWSEE